LMRSACGVGSPQSQRWRNSESVLWWIT
jgi:hypothetical protein